MKSFADKVVLITGSKSAIGKATAIKFADLGARVAIVGRDMAGLTATAKEIGSDVIPIQCDVTSSQDVKHAAPEIARRGGGAIINNASTGGLLGAAYMAAYSSSKAGVINLTRCAALELRAQNIRVNCVLPGIVDTPMAGRGEKTHASLQNETDAMVMAKQGRWIEPEDVANVVLYLASDDAVCVTGSNITVDCGMSASLY